MGIRLMLNLALRDNYVFFDPDAPLHLSVSEPRGTSPRLTSSILRGLMGKTIIDVDNVIDVKNRKLKEIKTIKVEVPKVPEKVEVKVIVEKEKVKEEIIPKKKQHKK